MDFTPISMNELIFFTQVILIIFFSLGALKLGSGALTGWVLLQALLANLFVLKQITLAGFDVTASDAFAIGSLLGLNFLQEHFSQAEAQKATRICFFFLIFFSLISQLHLLYRPNAADATHAAFMVLLNPTPRLVVASITVFYLVQQIDLKFFSFLKTRFSRVHFAWRAALALVLSQLLDTILFSFAGLYGTVSSITHVITVSFAIKLLVITCFTPIIRWTKHEALSL